MPDYKSLALQPLSVAKPFRKFMGTESGVVQMPLPDLIAMLDSQHEPGAQYVCTSYLSRQYHVLHVLAVHERRVYRAYCNASMVQPVLAIRRRRPEVSLTVWKRDWEPPCPAPEVRTAPLTADEVIDTRAARLEAMLSAYVPPTTED